ncbi:DUF1847 domain-containing protein [Pelotomaculum propionicicum]|uniref:DUF1847 domain-containing protein n=1 Tax=Pelotomaculum propionicicum TaxID=258475 RepID=UPI003B7808DE
MLNCAKCGSHPCYKGNLDNLPANCPMKSYGEIYEGAAVVYRESAGSMACIAARVEAGGYGVWPRIREIMEFSRLAGFNKLGLAFCVGLRNEAREVNRIFESNGFTVASVMCKTGCRPKEELGLRDDEKVRPGQLEAMCNPVAQALLLNKEQTDLNILLGLCVGHDTIFIKHSDAPITVLAVKDRATGHNPLAAVYAGHYFQSKVNLK